MKFVDMSNVAWDSKEVIFAGLNNCHGIVYATTAGLYAYHAAIAYTNSYNQNGKNKIAAFINFITGHARYKGATPVGLYGLCPKSRPIDDADGELRQTAEGIGYKGTISTGRWDTVALGWGSTWVVVTRGIGQTITATIERYETVNDGAKGTVANADPLDQKMATNEGTLAPMAQTGVYAQTNAGTRIDFTDWGQLLLPATKSYQPPKILTRDQRFGRLV